MKRTTYLVDGFNLYHSVCQASHDLGLSGSGTKWLDIRSLCSSYLYLIGGGATLEEVYYFTALAHHMKATKPEAVDRHMDFIECLRATGIQVELGRFRKKQRWCRLCNQLANYHEEKETDVAISVKLLELLFLNKSDTIVVVTGDTDIAPAVRAAHRLFPTKEICFAFPYRRKNKELENLVEISFQIDSLHYTSHQFPNPFTLPDGRTIPKPIKW